MGSFIVYDHPNVEVGHGIGHVNSDGRIYRHPTLEVGYDVGRVDGDGKIYDTIGASVGHCIGHVGSDGKIYDHPTLEVGHCVGRAGSDGRIYRHPTFQVDQCVGHVTGGPWKLAAGAAFLLLLRNAQPAPEGGYTPPKEPPKTPPKTPPKPAGVKPKAAVPLPSLGGGGFFGEFTIFFGILMIYAVIRLGFEAVTGAFPICLFIAIYIPCFIAIVRYKKYTDRNGQPPAEKVARAKQYAHTWARVLTVLIVAADLVYVVMTHPVMLVFVAAAPLEYLFLWMAFWKRMAMGTMEMRPLYTPKENSAARSKPKTPGKTVWKRAAGKKSGSAEPSGSDYMFLTCPRCQSKLRIPRKKGTILVSCPKCKTRFKMKY